MPPKSLARHDTLKPMSSHDARDYYSSDPLSSGNRDPDTTDVPRSLPPEAQQPYLHEPENTLIHKGLTPDLTLTAYFSGSTMTLSNCPSSQQYFSSDFHSDKTPRTTPPPETSVPPPIQPPPIEAPPTPTPAAAAATASPDEAEAILPNDPNDPIMCVMVDGKYLLVPRSVLIEQGIITPPAPAEDDDILSLIPSIADTNPPTPLAGAKPRATGDTKIQPPTAKTRKLRAFDPEDCLAQEDEEPSVPVTAPAKQPSKKRPVMPVPVAGGEADDALLEKQRQLQRQAQLARPFRHHGGATGFTSAKRSNNNVHAAALDGFLPLRQYRECVLLPPPPPAPEKEPSADDDGTHTTRHPPTPSGRKLKPSLPSGYTYEILPIFVQMFASDMIQNAADVFQDILLSVCGTQGGVIERVELRSESSFIALIKTAFVYDVIHSLRCRVLMDRNGFWYAEDLRQFAHMKEYCEFVRNLPPTQRYQLTEGLPCMPLVVELSRMVDRDKILAPMAPPPFDVVMPYTQPQQPNDWAGRIPMLAMTQPHQQHPQQQLQQQQQRVTFGSGGTSYGHTAFQGQGMVPGFGFAPEGVLSAPPLDYGNIPQRPPPPYRKF